MSGVSLLLFHRVHVDVAKMLIENGADVNAVDGRKWTALHLVSQKGHVDVAKVLLENGADVNAVDEIERTALHFAAEKGHVDVAKVLIQNGADVNAVNKDKWTALHYAADSGWSVDVVKILVKNDADVDAKTSDGDTAFDLAVLRSRAVTSHSEKTLYMEEKYDDIVKYLKSIAPQCVFPQSLSHNRRKGDGRRYVRVKKKKDEN